MSYYQKFIIRLIKYCKIFILNLFDFTFKIRYGKTKKNILEERHHRMYLK